MESLLSKDKGELLLKIARLAIENNFSRKDETVEPTDSSLMVKSGTFVTLKIKGQLRGCIGNIEPVKSIYDGVKDNALSAAFHDHRFPALSADELARVHIGISILTSPQPLSYRDGDDLALKLRPGIDGVILRQGRAGATFLPQVWEQLPEAEPFLNHLCLKAGLPETAWRDSHPEIEVYQVQSFKEERL